MASSSMQSVERYQDTDTYHEASPERRRQMNRYKKECGISDEHMYLLLYQQDLENTPEATRQRSTMSSTAMLVIAVLLLWNSLSLARRGQDGANVPLIFLSLGSFALVAIVYFTGILNPYKRDVREVNKRLKDMPEVPDFADWDLAHPNKEDRKSARNRRK